MLALSVAFTGDGSLKWRKFVHKSDRTASFVKIEAVAEAFWMSSCVNKLDYVSKPVEELLRNRCFKRFQDERLRLLDRFHRGAVCQVNLAHRNIRGKGLLVKENIIVHL